ncbi:hypothetical protein LL946_10430 [Knoellia locipacati]|uniref:hypothetical protein n=1 Tax=Knoellia locipacati TaxID=882824 RepID=UPI0038511545
MTTAPVPTMPVSTVPVSTMPVAAKMHHQHQHDEPEGENAVDRNTCEQEASEGDNECKVDEWSLSQHQELLGSTLPTFVEGVPA